MKYLQDRLQEDGLKTQQVKGIFEKEVKSLVAQVTINNFLVEDQLRVTPPKSTEIKSQLAIHEVIARLLEPMNFKTISVETSTWKYFIGGSVGPS